MSASMPSEACPLLDLPTELRLLIYGFALQGTPAITIGTAQLVGTHADIVHRLYGDDRRPFAGMPTNHEPVIEAAYNPDRLSIIDPARIVLLPGLGLSPQPMTSANAVTCAHSSLLLVNKQIRSELRHHFGRARTSRCGLFVSYPHGLHVLTSLASSLMNQARSVHVAGTYTSENFDTTRAVRLPTSRGRPPGSDKTYHGNVTPNFAHELESLVTSVFGPKPRYPHIDRLEFRIYYSGNSSYHAVWGDDDSPVCIALRNVYAGEIGIEVWRGQYGTGVYLTASRLPGGGVGRGKRVVSTVWRRLEEGRRNEPSPGTWVLHPQWPQWGEVQS